MDLTLTLSAAAISLLWFFVHFILGGREVARPLRAGGDLPKLVRALSWLCWHFTSLLILALAVIFAASTQTGGDALLWTGTLLAAAMTAIGIYAARLFDQPFTIMPQGWLFLPIALLGAGALIY